MLGEDSASLGNVLSNVLLPESRVGLCVPFDSLRFGTRHRGFLGMGGTGISSCAAFNMVGWGRIKTTLLAILDHNSLAAHLD